MNQFNSVSITVDGVTYQITPMPPLKAIKIERKVAKMIAPIISNLIQTMDLDKKIEETDIDLTRLGEAFNQAIETMNEQEFEIFVLDLMSYVFIVDANGVPTQINREIFEAHFYCKTVSVYKVLFEVMKASNLSFFAVVGGGGGILKTIMSDYFQKQTKKPGSK